MHNPRGTALKPDTITVRIRREEELDADSADLTLTIEGSSVFSGSEAFKKAKELRALIEELKKVGIEESRFKLRSVEVNSQSFAGLKSSSAKYVLSVKDVKIEQLSTALGTISAQKGAKLTHLEWNYDRLNDTRRTLRALALSDALTQARLDAERLGVPLLGIYSLEEINTGMDYHSEYVTGRSMLAPMSARARVEDIGFELGNATTVSIDLKAEFRVGPWS